MQTRVIVAAERTPGTGMRRASGIGTRIARDHTVSYDSSEGNRPSRVKPASPCGAYGVKQRSH
jgi:hypothetical protein